MTLCLSCNRGMAPRIDGVVVHWASGLRGCSESHPHPNSITAAQEATR